ncbi:MAG TPA: hypothetical protein VF074_23480 [Pyrinomonadaceae bacterium]
MARPGGVTESGTVVYNKRAKYVASVILGLGGTTMIRRGLVFTLILTSFFVSGGNQTFSQDSGAGGERFPVGNWKVTLHPYSGPAFESMPLQVISVIGKSSHDGVVFWIRERRLQNRSEKRVLKASFAAFVYREQSPETLLFQHHLNTIGFEKVPVLAGTQWPNPCPQEPKYCPYGHAIAGVRRLLAPLIKDGTLEGEYRVAIGVSKVWFEDGSVWELSGSGPQTHHKAP